jgi:hypothetical protein
MRKTAQTIAITLAGLAAITCSVGCDPYMPCADPCPMAYEWKEYGQPKKPWICDAPSAEGGQGTMLCTQSCSVHADCAGSPDPAVNAVARCDQGVCVLGCRPGWTCPEGTGCEPNDEASIKATGYYGRCSQVFEGEPAPEHEGDLASPG